MLSLGKEIQLFQNIHGDYLVFARSRGFKGLFTTLFMFSGFAPVFLLRLQQYFFCRRWVLLSYRVHRYNLRNFGLDALPGCDIEKGLKIEHPYGVVIGAGVHIGENCEIHPGVLLGSRIAANQKATREDYPKIGNNVVIGAKSSVLGSVSIGDNSYIGAHTLVINNFPSNSLILGVPGKSVS